MLVLTETTDKLQFVLAGATTTNPLKASASWRDITTTGYTAGRTLASSNGATDIDLVGSPAASTQRLIDYLSVYNLDTVNATVTIKYDANAVEYIIWKGVLQPGEKVEYTSDTGFRTFTSNGVVISSSQIGFQSPTINVLNTVILSSDDTNANAVANTLEDVGGMSFAVVSGQTYWFRFAVFYTAAAAATGCRWTINGPSFTDLAYTAHYTLAATTETVGTQVNYQFPVNANATSLTAGNLVTLEGFVKPSADGTIQLQFASEVAGSAITAKAGSLLHWMRTL